jgi:hypothetical protein
VFAMKASRTVWIAHTAALPALANLAVNTLVGGCEFVSKLSQAEKDARTNGGGRVCKVTITVEEAETPK